MQRPQPARAHGPNGRRRRASLFHKPPAGVLNYLLLTIFVFAACSRDDDALNEVERFRIMAIQAEPPAIKPGEALRLSALAYDPSDRPLSYSWSFCPVSLSEFNNFECPITEQMLIDQLADAGFELPPFVPISFEIGTEPEVEIPNLLTEEIIEALCAGLSNAELPEGVPPISCNDAFVLTLRLEIRTDASDGAEEIAVAIKELPILLDPDAIANTNPSIEGLLAGLPDESPEEVVDGSRFQFDQDYDLVALIEPEASEPFLDPEPDGTTELEEEALFITWFITGGSTETSRTSYIAGELEFDGLLENSWTSPKAEETEGEEQLFLVLQDERGGVTWLTRTVSIEDSN